MLRCVLLSFGSAQLIRRARINSLRLCVVLVRIDRSSRYLFEREGTTLFVLATGGQSLRSSINNTHSTSEHQRPKLEQAKCCVCIVGTSVIVHTCVSVCPD